MRPSILYTYFGHHKCATQWVHSILKSVCSDIGLQYRQIHTQKLQVLNQDLGGFVKENGLDFLAYVTAVPQRLNELGDFRGFHVIRDPRDICVSAYFSHLYSHPITEYTPYVAADREELKMLSKDEGLLLVIKGRRQQFESMYNWDYCQPNVLELKMEHLIQAPYQGFLEILDFLGLLDKARLSATGQLSYRLKATVNSMLTRLGRKTRLLASFHVTRCRIPAERLLAKVYNNRFSQKAKGRAPGEEDVQSHYRRGIAGDWGNHFSEEHIAYFREHHSEVLVKLGYESGPDW